MLIGSIIELYLANLLRAHSEILLKALFVLVNWYFQWYNDK